MVIKRGRPRAKENVGRKRNVWDVTASASVLVLDIRITAEEEEGNGRA